MTIEAVYRNGVFYPSSPPGLADGDVVQLTLAEPKRRTGARRPFEILSAITARSARPRQENELLDDASVNHDKYLYGGDDRDVR